MADTEAEVEVEAEPSQDTSSVQRLAGNISRYVEQWREVTSNEFILRIVREGYKLQFTSAPVQSEPIISGSNSKTYFDGINNEIAKFLKSGAISQVKPSLDQFVSRVFLVKKSNGDNRLIIDLSKLNKFINKISFRMEGTGDLKHMIQKEDCMISIDLSEAFFSVPLHASCRKYVSFEFDSRRYWFNVLPFGLTSSPKIFRKVLRPVTIYLRSSGIRISAYMDDLFMCSHSASILLKHRDIVLKLLSNLGFYPNLGKSQLEPSTSMLHLGYLWNSNTMSVALTEDKCTKTRRLAARYQTGCSLRQLASFIGLLVSHRNGFPYAPLYYRELQACYIDLLPSTKWDDITTLSEEAISDLAWWSENSHYPLPPANIKLSVPSVKVYTDASQNGWGMSCSNGVFASGSWTSSQLRFHINYLELLAAVLAVNNLLEQGKQSHIHIITDNSSVMYYINNMGGTHSRPMCQLSLDLWSTCRAKNTWLSASHIPGVNNTEADFLSRNSLIGSNHEYNLNQSVFEDLMTFLNVTPEIDLFASRKSCKLDRYVSKLWDPLAWRIDAFSFSWDFTAYMFPPICLITAVVDKFLKDKSPEGILITPLWHGLSVIPALFKVLISDPVFIPGHCMEGARPTRHAFHLVAWNISTITVKTQAYQKLRQKRCSKASAQELLNPTIDTGISSPIGWSKLGIILQSLYS